MTPTDADRAKAHKIAEHLCDFFDTGEHDGTCVEIADALAEQRERAEKAEAEAAELRDWQQRAIPRILSVVAVDEIARLRAALRAIDDELIARGVDHTKAGASIQKRIAEALAPAAPEPPLLGPVPTPVEIDTMGEPCSTCAPFGGEGNVPACNPAARRTLPSYEGHDGVHGCYLVPCPACRKETP